MLGPLNHRLFYVIGYCVLIKENCFSDKMNDQATYPGSRSGDLLTAPQYAGLIAGVIVLLITTLLVIFWCRRRAMKKKLLACNSRPRRYFVKTVISYYFVLMNS